MTKGFDLGRVLVWIGFALVVAGAGWSLGERHRLESRHRAVALAVEWPVLQEVTSAAPYTLTESLAKLRSQGLTAIVAPEETLRTLELEGRVGIRGGDITVPSGDEDRIREGLARAGIPIASGSVTPEGTLLTTAAPAEALRVVSLGVPPEVLRLGFPIIARYGTRATAPAGYATKVFESAPVWGYLPQGDSALGARDPEVKRRAELGENPLGKQPLVYCSPEFARIAGESTLLEMLADRTVRLHAIQAAEMDRMSPTEVVERYARAYSERNHRVLLIRPFLPVVRGDAVTTLADSLTRVRIAVEREGGQAKMPTPMGASGYEPPLLAKVAIQAGVTIALLGAILVFFPGLPVERTVFGALLIAFPESIVALVGAVLFPVLAYMLFGREPRGPTLLRYAGMSVLSLGGGLAVAGLLNGVEFFVKADAFAGVRVAHFAPILIVGLLALAAVRPLREVLTSPMTWGGVGLVLLGAGALVFMLARTGNENPGAVSAIEMQLRNLLERVMVVRPRTKEFLIGFPALWAALSLQAWAWGRSDRGRWLPGVAALFTAGMIGTTSTVNTMCHLHTPVAVGLVRVGIGVVLGLLFGLALWALIRSRLPREVNP